MAKKAAKRRRPGKFVRIKQYDGWFEIYVENEKIMECLDKHELVALLAVLNKLEISHVMEVIDEEPFDTSDL